VAVTSTERTPAAAYFIAVAAPEKLSSSGWAKQKRRERLIEFLPRLCYQ
jgi:hypothetical protein